MAVWKRKNESIIVCPVGHVMIVTDGEKPKFCYECGRKIDYSPEAQTFKLCKKCGRPITKDINKINNGFREEYLESGICTDCWVKKNHDRLSLIKVQASEHIW